MRIVANYRQRAEECRKLARLAEDVEASKVFEDMAENLDLLADLRIGDKPEGQMTSVPARHSKRFGSIT